MHRGPGRTRRASSRRQVMAIDEDKLMRVPGQVRRRPRRDDGGRQRRHRAPARALRGAGRGPGDAPTSSPTRTETDPRYVAEWLRGQAAGGYVEYDAATDTYSMTRGAGVRAGRPGRRRCTCPGAFLLALGALRAEPRDHRGVPHRRRLRLARARRGRVRRLRAVLPARLRRQPGAELDPGARRRRGEAAGRRAGRRRRLRARRVDGAAGPGVPRTRRSPARTTTSSSIELARKRAADAGVADRASFEVASAQTFPGTGYDLVTTFDCLHDMGDPLGAASTSAVRSRRTAPG